MVLFEGMNVESILSDFKEGKPVMLVGGENDGKIICSAEFITPEIMSFMLKTGGASVALALSADFFDRLQLPVKEGDEKVSVGARESISAGISIQARIKTIFTVIADTIQHSDIVSPGPVFLFRAQKGGVLSKAGVVEGAVDFAVFSKLKAAVVMCKVLTQEGRSAPFSTLETFAKNQGLKMLFVSDMVKYRLRHEKVVRKITQANLPTRFAIHGRDNFVIILYKNRWDQKSHIALVLGEVSCNDPILVRIHSACMTGDVFGSKRCDCHHQLQVSLKQISQEGRGVLVYMNQEGCGIGLVNKIHAYALQDKGEDSIEANKKLGFGADLRHYGIGAQILFDLGIKKIRLLTNNPQKVFDLQEYGLDVIERVSIQIGITNENMSYIQTKIRKMGHLIEL